MRYTGKTLGKRLLIDLTYALHYQSQQQQPRLPDVPLVEYTASAARPFSLADFEPLPGCQVEVASGFNPCPITRYVTGLGIYRTQELLRHQARSAVTLFLSGLGLHSIKAGFDFEYLSSNLTLGISGQPGYNAVYRTTADGSDIRRGSGLGTLIDGQPRLLDRFQSTTGVRNWTAYLRDSWSIASTGLTLNAGVRWEGVEVLGGTGKTELSNMANFAPRIGAVWDYTRLFQRPGRGKLFVNYGRFYESIGTDLADRAFNGQGGYVQRYSGMSSGCPLVPRQSGGRPLPTPGSGCNFDASVAFAGSSVEVIPGTSASAVDEVSAGVSYDLGYDFVVSASYLYRTLNNVIEDLSVDDGANYYVGTPGKSLDPATLAAAEADAQRLADLAASAGASAADKEAAAQAAARLTAYKGIADMPKATRDYHALVLSLSKRLSHRFSLLGSYTFSRTVGNYPGTYDSVTGQLNPHTATLFDLPGHIANSDGTLPTDRPHNFKLTGFYQQPLGTTGVLTFSATFSAISGRPIDVLGAHPAYGQVFILPRGSGGRTPTVTQTDVHLGYDHMIAEKQHMGVYLDVVNLFNQSEVVNVDDIYTYSPVNPLLDESSRKSLDIKTVDGSKLVYNSNYGQPTGFQAPLYLRLGARITF